MLRDAYRMVLELQGYQVACAVDGQQALELCVRHEYDVILLDLMMPVVDGIGFLEAANLHEYAPDTRVVLLSNLSFGQIIEKAKRLGAHRREVKSSLSPMDLVAIVEEELEHAGAFSSR
jgi:CheY-like chemotaxis protein